MTNLGWIVGVHSLQRTLDLFVSVYGAEAVNLEEKAALYGAAHSAMMRHV